MRFFKLKNFLALFCALLFCFYASLCLDIIVIAFARPFVEWLWSVIGNIWGNLAFFVLLGCLWAPMFSAFRKVCFRANVRKEGWAFTWAMILSFTGFVLPHWMYFPETGPGISLLCGLTHVCLLIGFAVAGSRPARRSLRGFGLSILTLLRLRGIDV